MSSQLFLVASLLLLNVAASCGESEEKLTATPTAAPTAAPAPAPAPGVATTQLTWTNGADAIFATHCGGCHDWALNLPQLKTKQQVALARIKSPTNPMPKNPKTEWSADKQKAIEFLTMAELK